jgi:Zn-dependent protease with chaperone function
MTTQRKVLQGIPPSAWEHPADRAALRTLKNVPGLDAVLRFVLGNTTERSLRLIALASSVRVGPGQFPRVHRLHLEACRLLDMPYVPEVYVSQSPFLNAGAVGMDRPFITLNSATVDLLTDDELLAILGHELGHVKSGHVLYKTLLYILLQLSQFALNIPLTGLALMGVVAALQEWNRKSELSADRAALLTVQHVDTYVGLLMKTAGGNNVSQMDLGEFIKQAEEYNEGGSVLDTVYKLLNVLSLSHPFPVTRVLELINWVRSGEYDSLLNGQYQKADNTFFADMKEAASSYRDSAANATPSFDDMKDNVKKGFQQAKDMFDDLLKKK